MRSFEELCAGLMLVIFAGSILFLAGCAVRVLIQWGKR